MPFFSCGASLWRSSARIRPKKVQPIGIYFWHLRLGLFKSSIFGWWSWTYVVVPLLQGQMYFHQKHIFCNLGARWHKILEFVPSCPICGWQAWWCVFFSCGANLWRSSASIQPRKGPAPWNLFLTPAPRPLQVIFFGWWSWTYVVVPLLQGQMYFQKKTCVLQFGRVDTKFLNSSHHVLSVDDWPGDAFFFSCGANLWRSSASIQPRKGPAPWNLFLTPAPRPLQVIFFGWWSWTYVVVPLLQGQMYSQKKKHVFCNLGACWYKILEFVPSCPICGWLAWWCDFFPVGPTFEDYTPGNKRVSG